jgi:rhodanese-related sulfurtransferase
VSACNNSSNLTTNVQSPTTTAANPTGMIPVGTPETSSQNPGASLQSHSTGTITGANSVNIALILLTGQTLKGTLILFDGARIGGAELTIRQPDGKLVDLGRQSVNERQFQFIAVLNGTHTLIIHNPDPTVSTDYTLTYTIVTPAIFAPTTSAAPTVPSSSQASIGTSVLPQPSIPVVTTASIPAIGVQAAYQLIQNNKGNPDFIILDVRTPDEFNSGHLASAVNIDYYSSDFKDKIGQLDRNKEYLVYCRTGIRGASSVRIMLDLGFTKVQNLSGGIVEWVNAGYPTVH